MLGLLASWPQEALRLEAVLHEAETHEAEARTEAEARFFGLFFGLEAEARPRPGLEV